MFPIRPLYIRRKGHNFQFINNCNRISTKEIFNQIVYLKYLDKLRINKISVFFDVMTLNFIVCTCVSAVIS
jgi:hypothetical protein